MVVESNFHGGIGMVRGDKFSRRYRVTKVPTTVLISAAHLTFKNALSDLDAAAIVKKIISTSNSAGTGQIENAGAAGVGLIRFDLTDTDTLLFTADVKYFYDVQVTLDSGDIFTLESGITSAREQVTIAS